MSDCDCCKVFFVLNYNNLPEMNKKTNNLCYILLEASAIPIFLMIRKFS